jgi:excisionase family DNA binding protein
MSPIDTGELVTPTSAEADAARESARKLAPYVGSPLRVYVEVGGTAETLELPAAAGRLLVRLLAEMGQGRPVGLAGFPSDLTIEQASDLLNVPVERVGELLDDASISDRRVDGQRRIRLEDVLAYKNEFLKRRQASLAELAGLSQDLGLGY